MSCYTDTNELRHWAKGSVGKNHKYISRYQKNGKWYYVYKNNKKYNRIADWFGKDEYDEFQDSMRNMYEIENENKGKMSGKYAESIYRYEKAIAAYYKTPMGRLEKVGHRVIGIGQDFINNLLKKKK